jgi:pilus assembly protein FimV
VAEADVYLAYSRDLQAEEILKEAMRLNPTRVAIHSKMLEIYAKRRDAKSFDVLACEVYALTQGTGPAWEQACELGQQLDPANPMYQPGGSPPVANSGLPTDTEDRFGTVHTRPFDPTPIDDLPATNAAPAVDLDLDFSFDESAAPAPAPTHEGDGLSFDLDSAPSHPAFAANAESPPPAPAFDFEMPDLPFEDHSSTVKTDRPAEAPTDSFDTSDFDLHFPAEPVALPPLVDATQRIDVATPSASGSDNGMLSFDLGDLGGLGDLSLDLGATPSAPHEPSALDDIHAGDPLETKLSLASEFLAIGDTEGARSLAEEVLSHATGALQAKAKVFLANL